MASQMQLVIYEGYLGGDAEVSFTQSAKTVSNFRFASSRTYTAGDGKKVEETTWIRVTAWGKLAEVVGNYCKKGTHVIVQGSLKPGENGNPTVYQRKDGSYGASYEMTAEKVRILNPKSTSGESEIVAEADTDIEPGW